MEISTTRPNSKKFKPNMGDWISPSFESEFPADRNINFRSSSSSKRPKTVVSNFRGKSKPSIAKYLPWTDSFYPNLKDDLAVHKKKVAEVEDWLIKSLKVCFDGCFQIVPMLLLTGPTGVGKTATLKALSNELKYEITEWSSNPYESVPNLLYVDGVRQASNAMIDSMSQSQSTVFQNFLLRANKYQSLCSKNSRKIILVEEFPNVFLKDPASFHALLRSFSKKGQCPVVFIASDCTSGPSLENNLFPKDLQLQLKIHNISFNPIAPTMLTKALSNICSSRKEFLNSRDISKAALDEIVSNCKGDIRNAINALQFLTVGKKPSTNRKMPLSSEKSQCNRDTSLFLFHALGKILYCKRDPTLKQSNSYQLPPHLSHMNRLPLVSNPEDAFERTTISAEGFSLFLHENYLSFTEDIEISSNCASAFSDADIVSVEWNSNSMLEKYTSSLAARGLMFNLEEKKTNNKWKAIRKPQFYSNTKDINNWRSVLRRSFKETKMSLNELQTELVPYLTKIRPPLTNEQANAVNNIGTMTTQRIDRFKSESLCEKDMIEDNTNSQFNSLPILTHFQDTNAVTSDLKHDSDEEIVIEECDF